MNLSNVAYVALFVLKTWVSKNGLKQFVRCSRCPARKVEVQKAK